MNKTQTETNDGALHQTTERKFRHPFPIEIPKEEMFKRMETVSERIAEGLEKVNADRKKNSR